MEPRTDNVHLAAEVNALSLATSRHLERSRPHAVTRLPGLILERHVHVRVSPERDRPPRKDELGAEVQAAGVADRDRPLEAIGILRVANGPATGDEAARAREVSAPQSYISPVSRAHVWPPSGASMPNSRIRVLPISMVSPSTTRAVPMIGSPP
jgi:hypothetical protein